MVCISAVIVIFRVQARIKLREIVCEVLARFEDDSGALTLVKLEKDSGGVGGFQI